MPRRGRKGKLKDGWVYSRKGSKPSLAIHQWGGGEKEADSSSNTPETAAREI